MLTGERIGCPFPAAVLAAFLLVAAPVADAAAVVLQDGGGAQGENADEPWPELARAEELWSAGERDAARAALVAWVAPGLESLARGAGDEERIALGRRVSTLAYRAGLAAIDLEACGQVHAVLERTRAPEDEELLAAKVDLGGALFTSGDARAALPLFERVHAVWERTLEPDAPELLKVRINLGAARLSLGDAAGAREALELAHASAVRTLSPEKRNLLLVKQNLALARDRSGDLDGALQLSRELVELRERHWSRDVPGLLDARTNLAIRQRTAGDFEGARASFESVLAAWLERVPPDHPNALAAKTNLGATLHSLLDVEGADALFEEVHAAHAQRLPPDHPALLAVKGNLAVTRKELGDVARARALEEEVLDALSRSLPPEHPDRLHAAQNLADTLVALDDFDGALELVRPVLEVRSRTLPARHPDLLVTKQVVAQILLQRGDLEGSAALYEEVLEGWRATLPPTHERVAATKGALAGVSFDLGDVPRALALYEDVDAARRDLPADHPARLGNELNLARVRTFLGDADGAREVLERVFAVFAGKYPADDDRLLAAAGNLANLRSAQGDDAGALELRELVVAGQRARVGEAAPAYFDARARLAVSLADVGRTDEALAMLESARAGLLETCGPADRRTGQATIELAYLRRQLGDPRAARVLFEELVEVQSAFLPADDPRRLGASFDLARTLAEIGDREALAAVLADLFDDTLGLAPVLFRLSPRAARAGALRELRRADWLWYLAGAVDRDGYAAEFLTLIEHLRAVSTASEATARALTELPGLSDARAALARARRDLATASSEPPTEVDGLEAWREELVALALERDRLERELRRGLAEHGVSFEGPTARAIAAALGPDTAYVAYWRGRRFEPAPTDDDASLFRTWDVLAAFVVEPSGAVHRVELGEARDLERAVERWRSTLGASLQRGLEAADAQDAELEAGAALRAALLDPCLAVLGEERPRAIHVVADDLVHLVPLDALPTEDGTRVGETLRVLVEVSAVRLVTPPARAHRDEGPLVAFGGADYGARGADAGTELAVASALRSAAPSQFAPLLSARLEAEYAGALFEEYVGREPVVRLRDRATKDALLELAPRARYLHVATHGWFAPESAAVSMLDGAAEPDGGLRTSVELAQRTVVGFLPETLCGLALAGANHGPAGILTAEELAALDLTQCELAVLSACETNVGVRRAGQGIQSLQTALHAAGARTAITSLWKVDDAATRRLFEVFYTGLWQDGLGPADALWRAKTALRSEGHPVRDWAGWVLSGDPD